MTENTNTSQQKNHSKTAALVEGAIMVALATVLSYIRLMHFPWGGSVTVLSMLPIVLYSIKRGLTNGLMASFIFSLIQLGQGAVDGLFGWGLTPVMLIACIMLDYICPFTAIGLAGVFRRKGLAGWITGTAAAIILRFVCHFLSGVVIWHSAGKLWEGFVTDNEWLYSLCYNGAYMLPELVFTLTGAILLLKIPQTRKMLMTT
ncbi:MAG: energy-coupled thiamine transporter ThiT [Oscillospiraceae bacterium]|nr:energy-coupled thiamine transporter ThiT [Oscillospiraceae bacterium]